MTDANAFSKNKTRILIADDAHEARRNTRLMLSAIRDVEVVAIASNGIQAIEMTEEQHPDVLILDINMPGADGLTAYQRILEKHPDTGCIVVSVEKTPDMVDKAFAVGVQDYLAKPFTHAELERAVARASAHVLRVRQRIAHARLTATGNTLRFEQLAEEYLKAGRTDDEAVEVFEKLVAHPRCDLRWLEALTLIYAIRRDWGKLKTLAERLEREDKSNQ